MRPTIVASGIAFAMALALVFPAHALDIYGGGGVTTLAADDLERVYEAMEDDLGGSGLAADIVGPTNGVDLMVGAR